jgi:hypothetical protein
MNIRQILTIFILPKVHPAKYLFISRYPNAAINKKLLLNIKNGISAGNPTLTHYPNFPLTLSNQSA